MMNQINVVPYIDVMLVLLVIFMVAAPMMQPSMINLPNVDKAEQEVAEIPLRIEIRAENEYGLSDKGKETVYQSESELVMAILQILEEKTQRPVVIAADKAVRYEWVMNVMNALKRANVARVGLMVQPK
jgi:biopolymer transport protein TolR